MVDQHSNRLPAAIIFDGDDTLWLTEKLYDDARAQARLAVEVAGLNGQEWELLEREIDVSNVRQLGFSPQRFPTSCVEAYVASCKSAGRAPIKSIEQDLWRIASSPFEKPPRPVEGARKTVERLVSQGFRVALLTKGDEEIQLRRIEQSGLSDLFPLIRVVRDKTPAEILSMVEVLAAPTSATWMVGNSIKSDLLPAIEAGLNAVWIDAHVWEYERDTESLLDSRITKIARITELPDLIESRSSLQ
jgi:putative hydrolase of the HAD superfamily